MQGDNTEDEKGEDGDHGFDLKDLGQHDLRVSVQDLGREDVDALGDGVSVQRTGAEDTQGEHEQPLPGMSSSAGEEKRPDREAALAGLWLHMGGEG